MPPLPEPEYIHEIVEGTVYTLPDDEVALVVGTVPAAWAKILAPLAPTLEGLIVLRYGVAQIVPTSATLLPGLFVSERGATLTGLEAWEFMNKSFTLYPRADVLGIALPSATIKQMFVRELDFAAGPRVLAYESVDYTHTPSLITRLVVGEDAPTVPDLLRRYLPPTDLP